MSQETVLMQRYADAVNRHDRCTIHTLVGADGTGAVASLFTATRPGAPPPTRSLGVEVIECRASKIAELRDYHTVGDLTH